MAPGQQQRGSALEVFRVFLLLGLTSFGGPVAHLGYFRDAIVTRRGWLTEEAYGDLVSLCQFLPGPASSQVGMAIGLRRAGYAGMAAAWTAFTLPSALLMFGFALGVRSLGADSDAGWLLGLKAAAVAVVANAVLGMATTLATGTRRATIAVAAMAVVLLVPSAIAQVAAIAVGAVAGLTLLDEQAAADDEHEDGVPVRRRTAVGSLLLFGILLVALPVLANVVVSPVLDVADAFYRTGSLVFGGGHVVLPLLDTATVGRGWVDQQSFLAGYGAAQAVPGPLFTFSAYLGALIPTGQPSIVGAAVALGAIFLPSALLIVGALPFWERLRRDPRARSALAGAAAAVVGLLAAALYDPVFLEGITGARTMVVAGVAFVALAVWKAPAWAVVLAASAVGLVVL